jgi:hypothetical protein
MILLAVKVDAYVLEELPPFVFRVEVIRLRKWSGFVDSVTDVVTHNWERNNHV